MQAITHFGDPTLSKASGGIAVMPGAETVPEKSIPPPTALSQAPSRTRGAPAHPKPFSIFFVYRFIVAATFNRFYLETPGTRCNTEVYSWEHSRRLSDPRRKEETLKWAVVTTEEGISRPHPHQYRNGSRKWVRRDRTKCTRNQRTALISRLVTEHTVRPVLRWTCGKPQGIS